MKNPYRIIFYITLIITFYMSIVPASTIPNIAALSFISDKAVHLSIFFFISLSVRAFNLPSVELLNYEADDLIATYAKQIISLLTSSSLTNAATKYFPSEPFIGLPNSILV